MAEEARAKRAAIRSEVQALRASINEDPHDAAKRMAVGRRCTQIGELDSARQAFENALKIDGSLVEAHAALGEIYRLGGNPAAAAKQLGIVAEARRADPEAQRRHAESLAELAMQADGLYAQAVRAFRRAEEAAGATQPPSELLDLALQGRQHRLSRYEESLQLLHDTLADSALADRYWMIFGLLLGWAREGRILPWDDDADFGFFWEDHDRFLEAARRLETAGFRRVYRYVNNAGQPSLYAFARAGYKFEFYTMTREPEGFRYHTFGMPDDRWFEYRRTIPAHGFGSLRLVERDWRKPDDHEAALDGWYTEWRKPMPDEDYLEFCIYDEHDPWNPESSLYWAEVDAP